MNYQGSQLDDIHTALTFQRIKTRTIHMETCVRFPRLEPRLVGNRIRLD